MNENPLTTWRHSPGAYRRVFDDMHVIATVIQPLEENWDDVLCRYVISRKWFASVKLWGEEFPIDLGSYDTAAEGRTAVDKWLAEYEDSPR